MATLREEAMAYEPPQTLNIADLEKVPVSVEIFEKESKDADGKPFKYKYAVFNDEEYRVPASVLEKIQTILKLKPQVEHVKVKKSGSGLGTRYKVEALD